uniref:Uncharacterized protein n=1 Tax=Theropithecus gelada TaxID=9565 RepID=A0A8D2JWJ4_THEGE
MCSGGVCSFSSSSGAAGGRQLQTHPHPLSSWSLLMRLSHFWGGLVGPKQWVKDHLSGDRGRRPRQCQDRAGRRCQGRWRQGAAVLGDRTASVLRSSLSLAPTLTAVVPSLSSGGGRWSPHTDSPGLTSAPPGPTSG